MTTLNIEKNEGKAVLKLPLFFPNEVGVGLPFAYIGSSKKYTDKKNSFVICSCSDYSIKDIIIKYKNTKYIPENKKKNVIQSMFKALNILKISYNEDEYHIELSDLDIVDDILRKEFDLCIDFLLFQNTSRFSKLKKYVSFWKFVYDFLGYEQDSGYDYLLMELLTNYKITEHGVSIRHSWISNKYENLVINPENEKLFIDWIENL